MWKIETELYPGAWTERVENDLRRQVQEAFAPVDLHARSTTAPPVYEWEPPNFDAAIVAVRAGIAMADPTRPLHVSLSEEGGETWSFDMPVHDPARVEEHARLVAMETAIQEQVAAALIAHEVRARFLEQVGGE